MEEIPVYLFTGFMDSGKTSLIKSTLLGGEFNEEGRKTLLIVCEDGDEEYDEKELAAVNTQVVYLQDKSELCDEKIKELNLRYLPEQVFIEYNGTWEMSLILDLNVPEGWIVVQTLTTVDATTFEMYLNNMKAMMLEQFFMSDVVIFNRCDDDTPKSKFRRIVKAKNRKTQLAYERKDGTMDDGGDNELPYDMSSDELEITDADYGIWFLDCMDNPKNYIGKKVSFLALVYRPKGKFKDNIFVPGRFAMTCCVEDIQFIGMKCVYDKAYTLQHRGWINITAEIKYEFSFEYKGKGPVLHTISVTPAQKPDDELVYFS